MAKSNLERKGFVLVVRLYHSLSSKEVRAEMQSRNLEVRADAEAMEGAAYWVACS